MCGVQGVGQEPSQGAHKRSDYSEKTPDIGDRVSGVCVGGRHASGMAGKMFRLCSVQIGGQARLAEVRGLLGVQEIARAGRFKQVVERKGSVEAALAQFAAVDVFNVDPTESAGTSMSLIDRYR